MKKKPKILVIDDESHMRSMLNAVLTAKQYQVLQAASGTEALDLAVEHQPDLVLLDLLMPNMNGFQVCQSLREWYSGIIMVVSGREGEEDKLKAFKIGADDYILKPFSISELMARIEAHLRRAAQSAPSILPIITVGSLVIDITRRQVRRDGCELQLTPDRIRYPHAACSLCQLRGAQ